MTYATPAPTTRNASPDRIYTIGRYTVTRYKRSRNYAISYKHNGELIGLAVYLKGALNIAAELNRRDSPQAQVTTEQ
ncbi:MAG: hypothetical protein M0Z43_02945 [Acidithiobacillus sp.]|nr:hypothetical protein [Acidithiobacillus sp.]